MHTKTILLYVQAVACIFSVKTITNTIP